MGKVTTLTNEQVIENICVFDKIDWEDAINNHYDVMEGCGPEDYGDGYAFVTDDWESECEVNDFINQTITDAYKTALSAKYGNVEIDECTITEVFDREISVNTFDSFTISEVQFNIVVW